MGNGWRSKTDSVLVESRRLLRSEWIALLVVWVLLSALHASIDVAGNDYMAVLLGSFLDLVAYVVVNFRLVRASGRGGNVMRSRAAGFIVLGLLSGTPILVGLLLLLLPGIYLFVRWYWAYPILVASDTSVTDAMRRSWHETKDQLWLVAVIAICPFIPAIALAVIAVLLSFDLRSYSAALAFELPMTVTTLLTILLPVASWSALAPMHRDRTATP